MWCVHLNNWYERSVSCKFLVFILLIDLVFSHWKLTRHMFCVVITYVVSFYFWVFTFYGDIYIYWSGNLIDELRNSTYQCMICISEIRVTDRIWSCATCYHIYHLSCIRSWAKKSFQEPNIESGSSSVWRCPSCQTNYDMSPQLISYRCFCGRTENPEFHPARFTIPHGCDQVCSKVKRITFASNLSDYQCTHLCTEWV